jgi:hypothetical protein
MRAHGSAPIAPLCRFARTRVHVSCAWKGRAVLWPAHCVKSHRSPLAVGTRVMRTQQTGDGRVRGGEVQDRDPAELNGRDLDGVPAARPGTM